ncbi:MAG: alginate lyase family protein [Ignavibacteriales bacterium]|nr:alginate lyase family protein [Ignavibacteriales bacterium]MCB9259857.1 alginate lyase family protein [Ignavibacteriales bacterium]
MKKKYFVSLSIVFLTFLFFTISCSNIHKIENSKYYDLVVSTDKDRIINDAEKYLHLEPITITASFSERSLGTKHDFYSEGDYWWPNPISPDSPYVRRDGLTNPDNFKDHRIAMRNMSIYVAALTAAFKLTDDAKYSNKATEHLKAWFVNPETKMNPNMNFSQAIKGICAGRGIGLIDAIHLVEPARCVSVLKNLNAISNEDFNSIKKWFEEFLYWMNNSQFGIDERETLNNHATAWIMQASEYAKLTEKIEILEYCSKTFKERIIPTQVAADGSFPLELKRTKPYGYSLFNMDLFTTICQILSTEENNLWEFQLADGRGMKKVMEFIFPYIEDKSKWMLPADVMYWDEWPVRHPSLLFAGIKYNKAEYLNIWKTLLPLPKTDEGIRNFPIRQPILWID